MDLNTYLPPRVAVIELSGVIGVKLHAREFTQLLREVRGNARYKAVVLDIDSPGGSPYASEDIYLAARALAKRKPLVAAVRGVGASGSYMVACAGERIFALPSSVVGSIGVISLRPMVEDLLAKLGVEMRVAKTGDYKDMGSIFRAATAEEQAREQQFLDEIYTRFVEIVREGRPNLSADQIDAIATGEVFLGAKAREVGLIDEIGSLDDAVEWVAARAEIAPRTAVLRPRRGLAQLILGRAAASFVDSAAVAVADRVAVELAERLQRAAIRAPRL
jgi:protease-4